MDTAPISTPFDLINMQTISGKCLPEVLDRLPLVYAKSVTFSICLNMWCNFRPKKENATLQNKAEIRRFYQVMLLRPPFCQSPFSSLGRLRERCTLGKFGVSTWFSTNRLRRVPVTWQVIVVSAVVRMFSTSYLEHFSTISLWFCVAFFIFVYEKIQQGLETPGISKYHGELICFTQNFCVSPRPFWARRHCLSLCLFSSTTSKLHFHFLKIRPSNLTKKVTMCSWIVNASVHQKLCVSIYEVLHKCHKTFVLNKHWILGQPSWWCCQLGQWNSWWNLNFHDLPGKFRHVFTGFSCRSCPKFYPLTFALVWLERKDSSDFLVSPNLKDCQQVASICKVIGKQDVKTQGGRLVVYHWFRGKGHGLWPPKILLIIDAEQTERSTHELDNIKPPS